MAWWWCLLGAKPIREADSYKLYHKRLSWWKYEYKMISQWNAPANVWWSILALQWRHNECDGVSNHQPHDPDADQRKHQSSASLAFVRGIHRWPVNSPHKRPVTRKMFPFDDIIMEKPSPVYWGGLPQWGCSVCVPIHHIWSIGIHDKTMQPIVCHIPCLYSGAIVVVAREIYWQYWYHRLYYFYTRLNKIQLLRKKQVYTQASIHVLSAYSLGTFH